MSDNNDDLFDRIFPIDINEEMESSYIDYAMSVIVGRALPEVRDGLKPVHRRILYAMFDSGYRPERGYVKTALAVQNMGFTRGLSPKYMHDTPAVNDWVAGIVDSDPVLRALDFGMLREVAAVGYTALGGALGRLDLGEGRPPAPRRGSPRRRRSRTRRGSRPTGRAARR